METYFPKAKSLDALTEQEDTISYRPQEEGKTVDTRNWPPTQEAAVSG